MRSGGNDSNHNHPLPAGQDSVFLTVKRVACRWTPFSLKASRYIYLLALRLKGVQTTFFQRKAGLLGLDIGIYTNV